MKHTIPAETRSRVCQQRYHREKRLEGIAGPPLRRPPRTDPYVRNYRIRLLPWMMTNDIGTGTSCLVHEPQPLVRRSVRAIWHSGTVSVPVATDRHSPWSVFFPPQTPQPLAVELCSPTSQVLRDCLTSRKRAFWHCGISTSPTDPHPMTGIFPGSPSFREKCFKPCV
jgi:hypothetical protein